MTFIRFSGCNLKCNFCDTPHEQYQEMSIQEIIQKIKCYPTQRVVLTGGEPLLQADISLLKRLKLEDYKIHLETNGTIECDGEYYLDWITVSPKTGTNRIVNIDELKVLYPIDKDINTKREAKCYYLQPTDGQNKEENYKQAIEFIKANLMG